MKRQRSRWMRRWRKACGYVVALALGVWSTAADARTIGPAEMHYARGLIAFDQGDWEAAYEQLDRAVAADPEHAAALYYRGLTQARRGEGDAAIRDMEAAIAIDPSLQHAVLDIAIAHFDRGRYAEAEGWLERAYADVTERRTAALYLGLVKYRLGNYRDALSYLDEAKGDPALRQTAHYYTGLALVRLRRTEDARLEFASAASVGPRSEIGMVASRYATAVAVGDGERPWNIFADTQLGYDSNVTIGAADGIGNTAEDGDGAWVVRVGGDYRFIDSQFGVLRGGVEASQSTHFERRDFDLTSTRVRLHWISSLARVQYGLSLGYDFYGLDFRSFYQDALASPWVGMEVAEITATQVYYGFRHRDFLRAPFSPYRDGLNHALGVRQFFLLPDQRSVARIGYRFDAEDPEDAESGDLGRRLGARDFEYDAHQLEIGLGSAGEVPALGPLRAEAEYLFRYRDYTHPNSRTRMVERTGMVTDGVRRHDGENQFAVTLARDFAGDVGWLQRSTDRAEVTATFVGVVNDSNVSPFDYDRFTGLLGVQVWF